MGARGGSAARKFFTVGKPSMRARHRQKAGYFAYSALASGERKLGAKKVIFPVCQLALRNRQRHLDLRYGMRDNLLV